jgi:hypothetical protein
MEAISGELEAGWQDPHMYGRNTQDPLFIYSRNELVDGFYNHQDRLVQGPTDFVLDLGLPGADTSSSAHGLSNLIAPDYFSASGGLTLHTNIEAPGTEHEDRALALINPVGVSAQFLRGTLGGLATDVVYVGQGRYACVSSSGMQPGTEVQELISFMD